MQLKIISFSFLFILSLILTGCDSDSKQEIKDDINNGKTIESSKDNIDTSSWKTYTNKIYNFDINYPSEIQVDEGVTLEGTGSEHYSIGFSRGVEYGFMEIAPDSTNGSRGVGELRSYEQMIDGKKAIIEEWPNSAGGGQVNLKFTDPIDKWGTCDESEFCEHISLYGSERSNLEIFKKMISTINFN